MCLWQSLCPLVEWTWTLGDRATASQPLTCPPPLCRGGYQMAWPCGKSCQKNGCEHHPSLLGPVYLPLGHGFSPPSPFLSTPMCPHPHSTPRIRPLTDGTHTYPGRPSCDAVKFSRGGAPARCHALCQVPQMQPRALTLPSEMARPVQT